ncbi:DUF2057 family protein [Pseudenterobacter timonensis]|uniref:DUF2057 family protein n=1 Tax=Pseudenterobacter timonensis TaxID=1755099 RepID=A0ABV4A513_9ENTR
MNRIMLAVLMLFSGTVLANTTLELGENVVALAAANAKVSMFSKTLSLPEGKQQLAIKFDSPINPESVNQGRGRVTSVPYIITFQYNGPGKLLLSAGKVSDENEAKKEARDPTFALTANEQPVEFKLQKIDQESVNLFTDYKSLLGGDVGVQSNPHFPSEVRGSLDKVKNAYSMLSDQEKLMFMKWLMSN